MHITGHYLIFSLNIQVSCRNQNREIWGDILKDPSCGSFIPSILKAEGSFPILGMLQN